MTLTLRKRKQRRRAVRGAAILLACAVGLEFALVASWKPTPIDWPDVLGEGSLATLMLGWLLVVHRAPVERRIFVPLAIGLVVLFAGGLQDVLDEFLEGPAWTSISENVGKILGTVLLAVALQRWLREQAQRALRLHASSRRFERLSVTDRLTGLFNRAYFFEQLEVVQEEIAPACLILMDLDNFKLHNDTYGHVEGDKVLVELARVIRASIRDGDVPCRYGGEEFTVILPGVDLEHARGVAERIRSAFAGLEFHPAPDVTVQKTVSVGVAQLVPGETAQHFVERADAAMYDAKRSGKNRVSLAA